MAGEVAEKWWRKLRWWKCNRKEWRLVCKSTVEIKSSEKTAENTANWLSIRCGVLGWRFEQMKSPNFPLLLSLDSHGASMSFITHSCRVSGTVG
jgi:hypothetical protein